MTSMVCALLGALSGAASPARAASGSGATTTSPPRAESLELGDTEVERRHRLEKQNEQSRFALTPHEPNTILVADYHFSSIHVEPFLGENPDASEVTAGMKPTEVQFQFSLKFPIARSLVGDTGDLYAAYTNHSFWQLYAWDVSAPFRETDHTPEAWLRFDTDRAWGGVRLAFVRVGINHQSNGRAGSLSRSWNRAFATFVFDRPGLALAVKPWIILGGVEDNPDIGHTMGNVEVQAVWSPGRHTVALMARDNLDLRDNKGALRLDWSLPLYGTYRTYVQAFYGYGESLLDYDVRLASVGVGVQLTDFL